MPISDEEFQKLLEEAMGGPAEIRYRFITEKVSVTELTRKQFAEFLLVIRPAEKAIALKARAKAGDELARITLDQWVRGDPIARREEARLGLIGLWEEKCNEHAGFLLVTLGELPHEEFEKKMKGGCKVSFSPAPPGENGAPAAESKEDVEDIKKRIREKLGK